MPFTPLTDEEIREIGNRSSFYPPISTPSNSPKTFLFARTIAEAAANAAARHIYSASQAWSSPSSPWSNEIKDWLRREFPSAFPTSTQESKMNDKPERTTHEVLTAARDKLCELAMYEEAAAVRDARDAKPKSDEAHDARIREEARESAVKECLAAVRSAFGNAIHEGKSPDSAIAINAINSLLPPPPSPPLYVRLDDAETWLRFAVLEADDTKAISALRESARPVGGLSVEQVMDIFSLYVARNEKGEYVGWDALRSTLQAAARGGGK